MEKSSEKITKLIEKDGLKPTPAQAVAMHTMSKVKDVSELHAETEKEGDEVFAQKTRELWKEFQVHGLLKLDGKGGMEIKPIPDLDGKGFIKILELAGFDVKNGNVKYRKHSEHRKGGLTGDASANWGVLTLDGGESMIIDHHDNFEDNTKTKKESSAVRIANTQKELMDAGLLKKSETLRDTSATKFAYKTFVDAGLLKESAELQRFVDLVTDEDNEKYTDKEVKELFDPKKKLFSRTIIGLSKYLTADQIWELLKEKPDYKQPMSNDILKKFKAYDSSEKKEKTLLEFSDDIKRKMNGAEKAIERIAEEGFEIDSGRENFGKILIDTGRIMAVGKGEKEGYATNVSPELQFLPVRAAGYDSYVVYIPEQKRFKIFATKPLGDVEFDQGFNVRGNFWNSPNNNGGAPIVELEEILSKLCGKKTAIDGKLQEAMETEKEKRAVLLKEIKENNELIAELKKKIDSLNFDEKKCGKKNCERAEKLREELEKVIAAKLGTRKDCMQWPQKTAALGEIEKKINKLIEEMEKKKSPEKKKLSSVEMRYVDHVYVKFTEEWLELIKNHYTTKNGYNAARLPVAIKKRENDFWNQELFAEMVEDGKIRQENIPLAVEEIKKHIKI